MVFFVFVPIRMEIASFLEWMLFAIKVGPLVLIVVLVCNAALDFKSLKNIIHRIKYILDRDGA